MSSSTMSNKVNRYSVGDFGDKRLKKNRRETARAVN